MHVLVTFLIAVPKRQNFRKERFTLTHCSKGAVFQGKMARESGIALCVAAGALTVWLVRSQRLNQKSYVWHGAGLYFSKFAPTPPQPPTFFSQALLLKGFMIFQSRISSWEHSIQIHEPAGDSPYNNNSLLDFKSLARKWKKISKRIQLVVIQSHRNGKYFTVFHMAFQLYMWLL